MATHPFARMKARQRALDAAVKTGMRRAEARQKLNDLADAKVDEVITTEAAKAGVALPAASRKLGDGTIIAKIEEFCKAHPELIDAITKGLLVLIGL
jgi:hypothetical protein